LPGSFGIPGRQALSNAHKKGGKTVEQGRWQGGPRKGGAIAAQARVFGKSSSHSWRLHCFWRITGQELQLESKSEIEPRLDGNALRENITEIGNWLGFSFYNYMLFYRFVFLI